MRVKRSAGRAQLGASDESLDGTGPGPMRYKPRYFVWYRRQVNGRHALLRYLRTRRHGGGVSSNGRCCRPRTAKGETRFYTRAPTETLEAAMSPILVILKYVRAPALLPLQ